MRFYGGGGVKEWEFMEEIRNADSSLMKMIKEKGSFFIIKRGSPERDLVQ